MDALKAETIKVFLPDDDLAWISAEIVNEVKRGHYEINIDDVDYPDNLPRQKVITLKSLPGLDSLPMQNENMGATGVEDMSFLNFLHEASILDNIRRRFRSNLPYTYTGSICLATNPYHWLDLYTTELMDEHKDKLRHTLPPHAYATSATAYRGLRDFRKNQTILVSGESGAGKTETVKILMGHLAHISGKKTDETVDRVLKANPLLESFGNAKTLRNDNSSRFGKFTQLQFDDLCFLTGSRCVTYLLEKTRVVAQNDQERSYHIFYQLLAAPPRTKTALKLAGKSCSDFMYVNRGDLQTKAIEGVTDEAGFATTMEILKLLGIENAQQFDLLKLLAGILHLGQIQFVGDHEHSSVDKSSFDAVAVCCELFGLSPAAFIEKMTSRTLVVEREEMKVNIPVTKAIEGRDALAKEAYNRLFAWLVSAVNRSTMGKGEEVSKEDGAKAAVGLARRLREGEGVGEGEGGDGDATEDDDGPGPDDWSLLNMFSFVSFAAPLLPSPISPDNDNTRPTTPAPKDTATGSERSRLLSPMDGALRLFSPSRSKSDNKGSGKSKSDKAAQEKKKSLRDPPKHVDRLVGILDIFGFENFQINYFEQLCINFANERLQRRFTQDVFVIVQEEYKREGLKWEAIKCMENSAALELLEGRLGIIDLLNEESMRGQGNDLNFLAKMKSLCGGHSCYVTADVKMQKDTFAIKHYAGRVTYSVAGFVDRNSDTLGEDIHGLMVSSSNQLLKSIFGAVAGVGGDVAAGVGNAEGKGGAASKMQSFLKAASVTQKFKTQLAGLMSVIEGTSVQYVRCIKPNTVKSPRHFDRKMVVEQLRCAGMIDAIRISRAAYPYRVTHAEFATRFEGLRSSAWMRRKAIDTPLARTKALLDDVIKCDALPYLTSLQVEHDGEQAAAACKPSSSNGHKNSNGSGGDSRLKDKCTRLRATLECRPYEIGKTKVYFSAGLLEMFEDLRTRRVFKHIVDIQRVYRGHRGRLEYRAILKESMRGGGFEKGCMAVITGNCKTM